MSESHESPFRLTFTSTTVIASRFDASGSIEITKHSLKSEYYEYYKSALVHFDAQVGTKLVHDMNEIKSLFQEAVLPLTEKLSDRLGHVPEYSAMFVPSVFDDTARNAAVHAVLGDYINRPFKAGRSRQATCQGYGFLEGKNLGRPAEQCTDEESPLSLVIVLEQEKDFLYAWLMEVAFELGTCPTVQERFCRACGEEARKEVGNEAYQHRVESFLTDFVDGVLQEYSGDDVRAIVVSGETSTQWATAVAEIVQKAVGSESPKIMTEIVPSEVVAYGAAVWARMVQQEPHYFKIEDGNRPDYVTSHNEL